MSRLRPTLALAATLALAIALVACGGSDRSEESPQAVIQEATLAGIESAHVDFSLDAKASGKGGNLRVKLSGPFKGEGKGEIPQLDMDAEVKGSVQGRDLDFDGGLVLLPNSAYVNYEGIEYEVDPTTFSFVESALNQAQRRGGAEGGTGGATACGEAAAGLDISAFADDLANDGSVEVGGTETTKLSGDLDVAGAIDALTEVGEDPACKAQLNSVEGLPSPSELSDAEAEVERAVKGAHVDLYVGDDDIVRRIDARATIAPKGSDGPRKVEISFDLTLTGVNEEQEISAPGNAKPLNDLFLKLNVNPLELLNALQGGGGGLDDLLEGLDKAGGGSGGSGGGSSSGGSSGGGSEPGAGLRSYSECVQGASSAADLQKCAELL